MRWILLALLGSVSAWADTGLQLLPEGRRFRPTFVDPFEIRMALRFEGDQGIAANVGNYFSILGFRPLDGDGWAIDFGIEGGGYFTMRAEGSRFPLETADGTIGIYLEGSRDALQWQVRYTHVSAHLADGATGIPIPYSRETLSLRGAWAPDPYTQVYGGLHYLAHTIPVVPRLGVQFGANYFLPLSEMRITPYIGTDLRYRGETSPRWSLSTQLGFALNNPPEAYRSFRFFYAYFTGADPRGQFYQQAYTSHSFGIEMQI